LAFAILLVTTRPIRTDRIRAVNTTHARLAAGLRFAWREYRRDRALWVLLVVLPIFFISLSIAVTPDDPAPIELAERGQRTISTLSMVDVHGAIMVVITVAFLAGLAGLFVVLGSAEADRRLVIAGFRVSEVLASRLGVIVLASVLVSGVSLAVTAVSFAPQVWLTFALATLAIAVTYAMIGVVVGPLVGRLGGLYLMFLLPFLDLGLAQNIMFDAAFTPTFDETTGLLFALAWLAGLTAAAVGVFHRVAARHA